MLRIVFTAFFCCLTSLLPAQDTIMCTAAGHFHGTTFIVNQARGSWIFSSPAANAIKVIYQPKNYRKGELVSNAVIAKPRREGIQVMMDADTTITFSEQTAVRFHGGHLYFSVAEKVRCTLNSIFNQTPFSGFRFQLTDQEQIYGGGARALPMNRRGYRFDFYNQPNYAYGLGAANLNFSVPLLFSSNGYAIFFDNVSKGYADIGKSSTDILETGFFSGQLNFYFIAGNNLNELVHRYTQLTGRQEIPPRWAFGAFMSRFGYQSEAQATGILNQMLQQKFPLDAIIFDLFWFGDSIKGTMGNLDWMDHDKWPHPEEMIAGYRSRGIKTILITEPYVLNSTPNFGVTRNLQAVDSNGQPFLLHHFYFGNGGLLDLFRKDAQSWFLQQYEKQIDNGVAGWWGDLGEPETHPSSLFHNLSDLGYHRLFSADEVHNAYGQYWSKMLSDFYESQHPQERLFHLNRSGFAGSQRFHAFPWTGDVGRSWSGLQAQLPVLLGMSLCGIPYVHSDAGGFALGEKDPELYTRWLQFAAFTPIFRPHGTALGDLDKAVKNIEPEPVFYPEPYKSIVRNYYRLRYALEPYNYTLAYEQEAYGKPLMRPLFYYSSADTNLLHAPGEYYWGDAFLIAPVTDAGISRQQIYLPEGTWYDWFSSQKTEGGRWLNVPVTLSNIPVYVKAGSFIPMTDSLFNMDAYDGTHVSVRYYYAADSSSFILYDDDGKTPHALEQGKYELIEFSSSHWLHSKKHIAITAQGNYENAPKARTITLCFMGLPAKPELIKVNGKKSKAWKLLPDHSMVLTTVLSNKSVRIKVKLPQ